MARSKFFSHAGVLVVRTRDLRSGIDERVELEVEVPTDDRGKQAQLCARVAALDPVAGFRSYGEGAATFLASGRMVIAHYENVSDKPLSDTSDEPGHQQPPLFAA